VAFAPDEAMRESKAWQKKKAEAGWACLHWPKEYGGRGASPIERVIWSQEEGVYGKLSSACSSSATACAGPP
jgi:acyl-CoA dehydrogenase